MRKVWIRRLRTNSSHHISYFSTRITMHTMSTFYDEKGQSYRRFAVFTVPVTANFIFLPRTSKISQFLYVIISTIRFKFDPMRTSHLRFVIFTILVSVTLTFWPTPSNNWQNFPVILLNLHAKFQPILIKTVVNRPPTNF